MLIHSQNVRTSLSLQSPETAPDLKAQQTSSEIVPLGNPIASLNPSAKVMDLNQPRNAGIGLRKTSENRALSSSSAPDFDALLAELKKNREKWDDFWSDGKEKIYSFQWSKFCFCKDETTRGPFTMVVSDDEFRVLWSKNGTPATEYNPELRPMEGIFDHVAGILQGERKPYDIEISYDANLGFPTSINIDWSEFGADDLDGVAIENFDYIPD